MLVYRADAVLQRLVWVFRAEVCFVLVSSRRLLDPGYVWLLKFSCKFAMLPKQRVFKARCCNRKAANCS
ncbi:hypothetical protein SOVF_188730, partial [Spinacia oleracea]